MSTQISLSVPCDYTVPQFYKHAEPDTVADALTIGAGLYDVIHKKHADDRIRDLETRKQAEIADIRTKSDIKIQELSKQLEQLAQTQAQRLRELTDLQAEKEQQARKDENERLTRTHTQKLKELQTELLEIQERNVVLQARRTELESSRDTDIARAEESTKVLLQHALDEKQRGIERLEREKDKLTAVLEKQTTELQSLNEFVRRKPTVNVKTKGNEFESIFRTKIVAAFSVSPQFSIEDSAHNGYGHAGDYLMKWGEHTILWECKDYDKAIPAAEVDKFKRDMKENGEVRIGVMVSRFTPIVGKTGSGDRHIEFLDGKMYIYLSQFEDMSDDTLKNLMPLFQFWWQSEKNTESDESRITAVRHIEKLFEDAVKARTAWRMHKTRMEEALRWMAETVEENETRLQKALNILNGAVCLTGIPEGIFRICEGDEKATQLIQLLLEFIEPAAESSIILNELADHISKRQLISVNTAKLHIRSVLLDSVLDTPKGKPTRICGVAFKPILPKNSMYLGGSGSSGT
jgi:hypothetical protein